MFVETLPVKVDYFKTHYFETGSILQDESLARSQRKTEATGLEVQYLFLMEMVTSS